MLSVSVCGCEKGPDPNENQAMALAWIGNIESFLTTNESVFCVEQETEE